MSWEEVLQIEKGIMDKMPWRVAEQKRQAEYDAEMKSIDPLEVARSTSNQADLGAITETQIDQINRNIINSNANVNNIQDVTKNSKRS